MSPNRAVIVGGGLAGCEAAWQIVRTGLDVLLYEMKPHRYSDAHLSNHLSELVCSNSLGSTSLRNASGILKEEMRALDSLVIRAADMTSVPAGGALAVDRDLFARLVTWILEGVGGVEIVREEVTTLPEERPCIIATGPLTSEPMAGALSALTGRELLYFYDAIAPIVDVESIDHTIAFRASRYDKGGDDYINCPLDREEYYALIRAMLEAEKVPLAKHDRGLYFEGCLPVEEMASRGIETLAHGPLKPVGLTDPRTGERPYAVVQLRQDDLCATMYNMVGFQTRLTWTEQRRVFRMIPGLEKAEFHRLGSAHRNTYVNAPGFLDPTLRVKTVEGLFVAGQLSGVEGYVDSAAAGLLAGIGVSRIMRGLAPSAPPVTTVCGSLVHYISGADPKRFQPMNANFGLLPDLEGTGKRRRDREAMSRRALADIRIWRESLEA
ncbi:methylenetetrahydrofolate--tRNA-(uracil(54)-C(5))-methyltransferase (FADH(2)-oxidizing) TrmFO [Thermodesulfobacteriota bacterium]